MNKALADLRAWALETNRPRWRVLASTILLVLMCVGMTASFWYLYYTAGAMQCYRGFFYLSVVWLAAELIILGGLFSYRDIPRFFRDAITMLIACSNIWFGLFVFSLSSCNP